MEYTAPETVKAAVALLAKAKGSAYVLAGGSDLLVRMKGGFIEPDLVVDIKRIKAMREIKKTATGFSIGAAVPCAGNLRNVVPALMGARDERFPRQPKPRAEAAISLLAVHQCVVGCLGRAGVG